MKKVESSKSDARDGFANHFVEVLNSKRIREIALKSIPAETFSFKTELTTHGFSRPFIVQGESRRFGLQLPQRTMKISEIANLVGHDTPVRLIDVEKQTEIMRHTITQYSDYLSKYSQERIVPKVLNMISLEFSHTPLSLYVNAPNFVNSIDWVRCVWPTSELANSMFCRVQKYCLAGMGGAYTDFHIDFGGTSVWYHILWGRKRFYLIPPTLKNLLIYEQWTCSPEQSTTFLGDLVDNDCYYFDLLPGQTLIIPSGWIHSVYTPHDSLVFGGNFLHSYSIVSQLQANLIEARTNVSKAFTFPQFRLSHWFLLINILPIAQKMISEEAWEAEENNIQQELCAHLCLPFVLKQWSILLKTFETWLADEELTSFISSLTVKSETAPIEVIKQWWEVIKAIAAQSPAAQSPNTEDILSFITEVEQMNKIGLLDRDWNVLIHGKATEEGSGDDGRELYISPGDILPFDAEKYCQWGRGVIADEDTPSSTVAAAAVNIDGIDNSGKDKSKVKGKKRKVSDDDSEYDGNDNDTMNNHGVGKTNYDDDFLLDDDEDEHTNNKPKKVKTVPLNTTSAAVSGVAGKKAVPAQNGSSKKAAVVGAVGIVGGPAKYASRNFILKKMMGGRR